MRGEWRGGRGRENESEERKHERFREELSRRTNEVQERATHVARIRKRERARAL